MRCERKRTSIGLRRMGVGKSPAIVLYVALMVVIVVVMDLLFFRDRFWERLMVNVGIVLVFAAFYFRFMKHP